MQLDRPLSADCKECFGIFYFSGTGPGKKNLLRGIFPFCNIGYNSKSGPITKIVVFFEVHFLSLLLPRLSLFIVLVFN
jgi:hypothetical protein